MMEDLLIGPFPLIENLSIINKQCNDLLNEGWIPFLITTKGKFLEEVRSSLIPEQRPLLKGIIFSIAYRKLYEA